MILLWENIYSRLQNCYNKYCNFATSRLKNNFDRQVLLFNTRIVLKYKNTGTNWIEFGQILLDEMLKSFTIHWNLELKIWLKPSNYDDLNRENATRTFLKYQFTTIVIAINTAFFLIVHYRLVLCSKNQIIKRHRLQEGLQSLDISQVRKKPQNCVIAEMATKCISAKLICRWWNTKVEESAPRKATYM